MATAVYPGSFDPITNGHLDIIRRSSVTFDKLIIAVLENEEKSPLFSVDERVQMIREACGGIENTEVRSFSGLLVRFMESVGSTIVLRGIRAVSDYEYELQMALMNRELSPEIETLFMLPSIEYNYVSSRLVKEVRRYGGDVSSLVPDVVLRALENQFS